MNGEASEPTHLSVRVIFDHPLDCPTHYVMRTQHVIDGHVAHSTVATISEDVEHLRALCERAGLTRLERQPDDDPAILEVWL